MAQTKIWSRIGGWFKTPKQRGNIDAGKSDIDRFDDVAAGFGTLRTIPDAATDVAAITKVRLSRQERLEDGYTKVVTLVESIQTHLEIQDKRSEQIAGALDRLAECMAHGPEAAKAQIELLATMNNQLEVEGARGKRVEETLSELPRIADAQRETMVTMGHQLNLLRESGDRGNETLGQFQSAVTRLGETTTASTETLQRIHVETGRREAETAQLLREQTSRITLFSAVTIATAVIAVAISIIAFVRN